MELDITTRPVGDQTVVSVGGEVDVLSAPELDEVLSSLIAAGSTRVIVDLGGVGFLDSTGLGVLVKALKRCREAGGSLTVAAATERTVKLLRITGLDTAFSLAPTVDDALA